MALGLLRAVGDPDPPMDAFGLAGLCEVRVEFANIQGAKLRGDVITVSSRARPTRQHGLVAHEMGHWALQWAGEPDTEVAASYVGAALMLPRRPFLADMRATQWDVRELRAKHVNCSAELIARRIATLTDACVSIWDNGRLKSRVSSPWLPEPARRISAFERELAARVLDSGQTERAANLAWGFAVFEGDWRRVITVCEAEQLGFRY